MLPRAKCFYLGSYYKVEAIQANKKYARNLAAQFLLDELQLRYQQYSGTFKNRFRVLKNLNFLTEFS